MNKAELIEALAGRLGDKKSATAALDAVLAEIQAAVTKGDKVAITGFGVFEKRVRAARTARNPRTGEAVKVKKTRFRRSAPAPASRRWWPAARRQGRRRGEEDGQGGGEGHTQDDRRQGDHRQGNDGAKTTARRRPPRQPRKATTAKATPAKKTAARKTTPATTARRPLRPRRRRQEGTGRQDGRQEGARGRKAR